MRGRAGGRAFAAGLAAAGLAAGASPGCNQLVGADDFHVEGRASAPACETNAQCAARNNGAPSICRRADRQCARLTSAECAFVAGDATNDYAVLVGAIGPTSGVDALLGRATQNALTLALQDFTALANGLPAAAPGGPRRPLAVVACDEAKGALAAARHLAALGVPAVVGGASSAVTTQIATEVTIPAGVLLLSPSATSPSLTDLVDQGLVWRTAPSDVQQGSALALLAGEFADARREAPGAPAALSVVALYRDDSYGKGLYGEVSRLLRFGGESLLGPGDRFEAVTYGNPDDPASTPDLGARYDQAAADVVARRPHFVLALGTTEVVTNLLPRVEEAWPADAGERPVYFLPDGGYVSQLVELMAANPSLRGRVFGTAPAALGATFEPFRARYEATFRDGTSADSIGAAGAFDAFYLIAFALAAAPPEAPLDGAAVARGIGRLVPPGAPVELDQRAINSAFGALGRGENLDVQGASGALDFDVATGDTTAGLLVWCPAPSGSPPDALPVPSGRFLDPATGRLTGALRCPP